MRVRGSRGRWALGAAAGVVLDRRFGEVATPVHPLVHFGNTMNRVENRLYRDERTAGAWHTLVGVGLGALASSVVRSSALATYVAVGGRALGEAAAEVQSALDDGDLERARERTSRIVGRETAELGADELARAVVETLGENTVDAVVGPALWGALGGPAGALVYRCVNTMDAMVGHHSARYENYGWASARADDVANWIPARLSVALVAAVRPGRARAIYRALRDQAPAHPSPNAGLAEAAFAAALGVRLGGANRYGDRVEIRPTLGEGSTPESHDIARAIDLSRDVSFALVASLLATAWWIGRRR